MRIQFLAAAVLCTAAPAASASYTALNTFGDSLVDSGNLQAATNKAGLPDNTPAASGYYQGRFSNQYNAADYLSLALTGHVATGSLLGGTDFAFGGALAATNTDFVPDLAAQTGLFAQATRGHADPNALYFINAGGNDGFAQVFGRPGAPSAAQSGAAIAATIQTLELLGARHFLVDNVSDLGNTPIVRGAGLSAEGTAASRALNRAIASALRGLMLPPGDTLKLFNAYGLGLRLNADPAAFGLAGLNTTVPCTTAKAFPACDRWEGGTRIMTYEFFDTVHPTDAVYQIFGRGLVQTVPEPATLALFGLGLAAFALRRRACA